MRFAVEYPIRSGADDGAWLLPANVAEFARVAEASGFDAIALTDHPAPSRKWLDRGGHETLDPFVGLAFAAAVTQRIRLLTYLAVLPYRNPFLTAKSMASVDRLSGGRAIFALGAGYLRSEFSALGVDFDERNELFDEAALVIRRLFREDELHHRGRHFTARGVALAPKPAQAPHPPLWLGGNAKIVRERVADWGDGWAPLLGPPELTRTTRTPAIASDDELAARIREIRRAMAERGRDPAALDVCALGCSPPPPDAPAEEQIAHLAGLSERGVTWTLAPGTRNSFPEALSGLRRYGEEVIAKLR